MRQTQKRFCNTIAAKCAPTKYIFDDSTGGTLNCDGQRSAAVTFARAENFRWQHDSLPPESAVAAALPPTPSFGGQAASALHDAPDGARRSRRFTARMTARTKFSNALIPPHVEAG